MKSTFFLSTLTSLSLASANYLRAAGEYEDFQFLMLNISVGNPAVQVSIEVDTGSSETWFNPLSTGFKPESSASYVNTSVPMHLEYADGRKFDGFMAKERLIIAGGIISDANIGVAEYPHPTHPRHRPQTGFMGLGLEEGEMVNPRYPNLLSQMRSQGIIRRRSFGVYIDANQRAEVLFGGYDQDRIKGELRFTKMVNNRLNRIKDSPKPYEYDTLITSIMRNGKDILRRPGSRPKCVETFDAHFDTGYTLITVPRHVFDVIQADFGAQNIQQEGFADYQMDCNVPASNFKYTFDFNGVSVDVPAKALMMPVEQHSDDKCRLLIAPSLNSKTDNRLVMGLPFFRAAYVYFDPEDYRIGLAEQNIHATGDPHIVTAGPSYGPSCWINVNGLRKCN